MVNGATQAETGHGLEIERQYLSQYLTQDYVDAASLDLTSIDYTTAVGDPRVRDRRLRHRPARPGCGRRAVAAAMMPAGPQLGVPVQPLHRLRPGPQRRRELPAGPGFQPRPLEPGGQLGFEEGNAVQYTWAVRRTWVLVSLMGGDAAGAAELDTFFTRSTPPATPPTTGPATSPTVGAVGVRLLRGAWQTQRSCGGSPTAVPAARSTSRERRPRGTLLLVRLGGLGPVPGDPGQANLALASPLFPSVTIVAPGRSTPRRNGPGRDLLAALRSRGANRIGCDTTRPRRTGVHRSTREQR